MAKPSGTSMPSRRSVCKRAIFGPTTAASLSLRSSSQRNIHRALWRFHRMRSASHLGFRITSSRSPVPQIQFEQFVFILTSTVAVPGTVCLRIKRDRCKRAAKIAVYPCRAGKPMLARVYTARRALAPPVQIENTEATMITEPPFRAEHVGSLLRPAEIKEARAKLERNEISRSDLKDI